MRILNITSPDICNGLGCRVTVWVAGCSHHCPGCHNKHTWDYNIGDDIRNNEIRTNICKTIENELDKPYIKGITFSGGDPLDQSNDSLEWLLALVQGIREKYNLEKDIWIYSGDTYENLIKNELKYKILMFCDVLVDGPFEKDKLNVGLAFRGSTNQRIIDLKKSINADNVIELDI